MEEPIKKEKKETIRAAKQLGYSNGVIIKLETAKTVAELSRIMKDARNGKIT